VYQENIKGSNDRDKRQTTETNRAYLPRVSRNTPSYPLGSCAKVIAVRLRYNLVDFLTIRFKDFTPCTKAANIPKFTKMTCVGWVTNNRCQHMTITQWPPFCFLIPSLLPTYRLFSLQNAATNCHSSSQLLEAAGGSPGTASCPSLEHSMEVYQRQHSLHNSSPKEIGFTDFL
jgi:hypothetical protein